MRKGLRITLWVLCGLLLLAALVLFVLYRASQRVPEFYREAMAVDPAGQRKASDKLVDDARKLNNSLRTEGRWEAAFTAEEINGWLAVELPRANPPLLPREVRDPRVAIDLDGVTLAAHVESGRFSAVVSLRVDVALQSPNVLTARIRKARAGAAPLPLPLNQFLAGITQAAAQANIALRWQQTGGDPVALITLPPAIHNGKEARVDAIRLKKDRIVLSGTTQRKSP
jgi:hypothetical protein